LVAEKCTRYVPIYSELHKELQCRPGLDAKIGPAHGHAHGLALFVCQHGPTVVTFVVERVGASRYFFVRRGGSFRVGAQGEESEQREKVLDGRDDRGLQVGAHGRAQPRRCRGRRRGSDSTKLMWGIARGSAQEDVASGVS
jgi:hypothetical protein